MTRSICVHGILISLFVALELQPAPAPAQTINTVVGGGFYDPSNSPTGFAVGNPTAVAIDSNGNLYVADSMHGSVYKIDANTGVPSVVAGNGTVGNTPVLSAPTGLAVDAIGNLFIADSALDVVWKVPVSGGPPIIVAGCGTINNPTCPNQSTSFNDGGPATSAYLNGPYSVFVDGKGNLFIADSGNCRIREVSAGTINTVAGSQPKYSSACGYSGDGGLATSATLDFPSGITVDSVGDIFIADTMNGVVREVCASSAGPCGTGGYIKTVAGTGAEAFTGADVGQLGDGGSATSANLFSPKAVALDSSGNLYIADTGHHRIRIVNNMSFPITIASCPFVGSGAIQTIAGDGVPAFSGDGNISGGSSLHSPSGIVISGSVTISSDGYNRSGGLLFIADRLNFAVRAINLGVSGPTPTISLYGGKIQIPGADIETVAGNNSFADLIPDGDVSPQNFQLANILTVSEDASSNIYVGETPPRVLEATPSPTAPTVKPVAGIGTSGVPDEGDAGPALSAQLQSPQGLFLDSANDIFIADGVGGIEEVSAGVINAIVTTASLPQVQYNTAAINSLAGATNGNLYFGGTLAYLSGSVFDISNSYLNSSFQLNPTGAAAEGEYPYSDLGDNGSATSAVFGPIAGLCLDSTGNLFITDSRTSLVRVVNTGSTAITIAGVPIPPGFINTIAGGGGHLGMVGNHFYLDDIGDGGPATSALITPAGCFVDALGNIFIADEYNDRIREVDHSTGFITTIAGRQSPGFFGDGGLASSASLNFPNAIWGDQAGNLLISDSGNHRIREISGLLPVPNASLSCENCDLTNIPSSSTTAVVTITNTGNAPLVLSTGPSLTDSKDFTISSSSSSASACPIGPPGLGPQASCTVSVTANGTVPAGATVASTNLVFHDNAYLSSTNGPSGPTPDPANAGQLSGYLQSEAITFTSTTPTANFVPLSLVFSAENVAQSITVQNTGSVVLNVSSVTVSPVQAPFAFQTNPPSDSCSNTGAAFSVQPASKCNIYIVFTGGTGVVNPVVTIVDNAATSTQTIPLVGYALVPSGATSFSISNSSPAPVNATFTLVGIPSSASVAPVCSVTPAGLDVNCTYNQSSQTITATVSIPSCVQTSKANIPAHGGGAGYLPMGVVAIALLLPWGRSNRKRLLALMTFALLLYLATGLSACSSTNNVSSSCVASVPSGTKFNLRVTASPTTAGQFPSLTLTTPDVISVTQ